MHLSGCHVSVNTLRLPQIALCRMFHEHKSSHQGSLAIEPKIQYHGVSCGSSEPILVMIFLPGGIPNHSKPIVSILSFPEDLLMPFF